MKVQVANPRGFSLWASVKYREIFPSCFNEQSSDKNNKHSYIRYKIPKLNKIQNNLGLRCHKSGLDSYGH